MVDKESRRWFGPKVLGWGWSPASPAGWAVMAAFLFTLWLSYRVLGHGLAGKAVRLLVGGLLVLVILATGSRPGSRLFGASAR